MRPAAIAATEAACAAKAVCSSLERFAVAPAAAAAAPASCACMAGDMLQFAAACAAACPDVAAWSLTFMLVLLATD